MIDLKVIKELDKSQMATSIKALPDQCQQAWEEVNHLAIPSDYKAVKNIVVSGMGGSALGTHVIKSLYLRQLGVPVEIVNDYHLPAYVDEKTLVLLSSYSGGTEETLSCAQDALESKAKVVGITTGGKLGDFLKRNNFPGYIFQPKFNPCGQPRIGLGYSILGQIALFHKIGFITVQETQIEEAIKKIREENDKLKEKACQLAVQVHGKIPIIIAAEFLSGNAHILANQINENAKSFSSYFLLSELNHHLMEGLKNPQWVKNLAFLFIDSAGYSQKIRQRLNLTIEVVKKNKIETSRCFFGEMEKIPEVLSVLLCGTYLSFFLSILYKQDPSPIPWVDFFKEKLSAHEK